MKLKTVLLTALLGVGFFSLSQAQLKIGYANIEAILLYMNETKTMNQQLSTYEKKLGEDLQNRQRYYQTKVQEYLEFEKTTQDEAQLKPRQDEILKLEEEIQKKTQESQQKLLERRQTLLQPILEKMQKAIEELASEGGYDYIINSVDGQGVSIVLHGPEEHNLTKKLMTKLGVQLPEGEGP